MMEWRTKITEMIGCKYPIILGAFAGFDDKDLTAAISEAGGCGVLTASTYNTEDDFRNALNYVKEKTQNPFIVNFSTFSPITSEHKYYKFINFAKEANVKAIITAGSRVDHLGKAIKDNGLYWIHKGTTMKHALSGEKIGADAIILTGLEGGGLKNPDQNTFLINMIHAKKMLKKPFIASGGISEGRGMLSALMMGASAVHMCTAFLATVESPIPDNWKQKIIDADSFNPEFIKFVCHFTSLKPKSTDHSMAAGTVKQIITAKELIQNMITEAEEILKNLGLNSEIIQF
jgi:nitronate monooxygenase